jgi:2-methylaconitate cis-trans-isomerase PrpF
MDNQKDYNVNLSLKTGGVVRYRLSKEERGRLSTEIERYARGDTSLRGGVYSATGDVEINGVPHIGVSRVFIRFDDAAALEILMNEQAVVKPTVEAN